MSSFVAASIFVAGFDGSQLLWVEVMVTSVWQVLVLWSFYFSVDQQSLCNLLQVDYSYKVYSKTRHIAEALPSALCQGDQDIREGRIFLFLKFCMPSRMNPDLLLRQEISMDPKTETHQI